MNEAAVWDKWLMDADSVSPLAPTEYNDQDARTRVKMLGQQLTKALATYEVRTGTPELYQDSTGLAEYRLTAKGDSTPFTPTLAWILLSHFGDLATIRGCPDPELTDKIRNVLEDFGLKYIPYDYAASKIYRGLCKSLVGFSWANRYFSLVVEFNVNENRGG